MWCYYNIILLMLQDAKCIGSACIGCIKHSCEIDGDESFFELSSTEKETQNNESKSDERSPEDEKCYFQNNRGEKIDLDNISSEEKF